MYLLSAKLRSVSTRFPNESNFGLVDYKVRCCTFYHRLGLDEVFPHLESLSRAGEHGDVLACFEGEVVFDSGCAPNFSLALLGDRYKIPIFHQSGPLDLGFDPGEQPVLPLDTVLPHELGLHPQNEEGGAEAGHGPGEVHRAVTILVKDYFFSEDSRNLSSRLFKFRLHPDRIKSLWSISDSGIGSFSISANSFIKSSYVSP